MLQAMEGRPLEHIDCARAHPLVGGAQLNAPNRHDVAAVRRRARASLRCERARRANALTRGAHTNALGREGMHICAPESAHLAYGLHKEV